MVGKQPNPVAIRVYEKRENKIPTKWIKLKYAPGCQMRSMDMPEQRAYDLYELLHEYFTENFVE